MSFVKERLPNAYLDKEIGTEVKVILPVSEGQTNQFQAFFNDLDLHQDSLNLMSYGVSDTSLDQVSGIFVCITTIQLQFQL